LIWLCQIYGGQEIVRHKRETKTTFILGYPREDAQDLLRDDMGFYIERRRVAQSRKTRGYGWCFCARRYFPRNENR